MYTSQNYNYPQNLNTYDPKLTAVSSEESPFCQLGIKFYVTLLAYLEPLMNEITGGHQCKMCFAYI
jgi:hypothetical protein